MVKLIFISMVVSSIVIFSNTFYSSSIVDLASMTGRFDLSLGLNEHPLVLEAGIHFSNDSEYVDPVNERFYFGYYFYIDRGLMGLDFNDLKLRIGRYPRKDVVRSPYSLFLNSRGISTIGFDIVYEDSSILFQNSWMGLTREVKTGDYDFPDRGANYRVLALKLGDLRFGYQESVVYTGRFFDIEYFSSPVPNFFTQYFLYTGRPFRQGYNDNSMLGFFIDWNHSGVYSYAQVLIDDANANRFYGGFQNPDKIAWSLGLEFDMGDRRFGIYHAGATKYTFEPTSPDNPYGYVLFPAVVAPVGDSTRMIYPEENYIGYLHGENNAALSLIYSQEIGGFEFDLTFEGFVSGSVSPVNPWHEDQSVPEGTHFLDEDTLRKYYSLKSRITSENLGCLRPFLEIDYTKVLNDFDAREAEDGDGTILKPTPGKDSEEFTVKLGIILNLEW